MTKMTARPASDRLGGGVLRPIIRTAFNACKVFLPSWALVFLVPTLAITGSTGDGFIAQIFRLFLVSALLLALWPDTKEGLVGTSHSNAPKKISPTLLYLLVFASPALLYLIQYFVSILPLARSEAPEIIFGDLGVQLFLHLLVAVIAEELFFRCLAIRLLEDAGFSKLGAAIVSSLAFGASHLAGGLPAFVIAFLSGLWFHALLYFFGLRRARVSMRQQGKRSRSGFVLPEGLLALILVHLVFNIFIALTRFVQ